MIDTLNAMGFRLTKEDSSAIVVASNATEAYEKAEEEHAFDAVTSLFINLTIIGCLILAYYVKKFRIYYLPESSGALIVGMILGGIARLSTDKLQLFEFSPEFFFFVLLPPIIFHSGYALDSSHFFDNIGAITLFAFFGTIISTFVIGGCTFYAAKAGLISGIDKENPMEALLFGALISAVDPVATLSIMGNADLRCDQLLYSLVFGESVLNDAIAISLFKVFAKYYEESALDFKESDIPSALMSFISVSFFSILVGIGLGLLPSFLYKNTTLSDYPSLETALLFSFCYLCYAAGEVLGLSGIMALFFQGVTLAHYNSYNLSPTAHVASEQLFATLATLTETAVFLYMGMSVFTGLFKDYDFIFSALALIFCFFGRFMNIFPLSFVSNLCRQKGSNHISIKLQTVLWFAGLRGAIAFALAMNMPGPNRDVYATATLSICIFTTIVCGGLTEGMLTLFGMKEHSADDNGVNDDDHDDGLGTMNQVSFSPPSNSPPRHRADYPIARQASRRVYKGAKRLWKQFDDEVLKPYLGGSTSVRSASDGRNGGDNLGNYELGMTNGVDDDYD